MSPMRHTAATAEPRLITAGRAGELVALLGRRAGVTIGVGLLTAAIITALVHATSRGLGWELAGAPIAEDGVVLGVEASAGSVVVRGLPLLVPVAAAWTCLVAAGTLPRMAPALLALGTTRRSLTAALAAVLVGAYLTVPASMLACSALLDDGSAAGAVAGSSPTLAWLAAAVSGVATVSLLSVHAGVARIVVPVLAVALALLAVPVGALGVALPAGSVLAALLTVCLAGAFVVVGMRLQVA